MESIAHDGPPFTSIAIAGLGLIGGSIALGIRERWPACRVVGIDRAAVQAHALGSAAIDRGVDRLAQAGPVDLIVLAAPVRDNVGLLEEAGREAQSSTVITDVGGTKRDIVAASGTLARPAMFVGGHPIGGGERGGFGFARADLFRGRPWLFTPTAATSQAALDRLFAFVQGLGARPLVLDAARHDALMAFVSHLPQLTASALMQAVGAGAGDEGLRLAGRGLVDTTRLASSPANVWRDICAVNADAIRVALDALIAQLTSVRDELERGEHVEALFSQAARWRAELTKERQ